MSRTAKALKAIAVVGALGSLAAVGVSQGPPDFIWNLIPVGGAATAWSPNQPWVAFAGPNNIAIYNANTNQLVRQMSPSLATAIFNRTVSFNNDSSLLTAASGNSLMIFDTATGNQVALIVAPVGSISQVAFSPDGSKLAYSHSNGSIVIYDSGNWASPVLTLTDSTVPIIPWINGVVWSPDGTRVCGGDDGNILRVWNATTGDVVSRSGALLPSLWMEVCGWVNNSTTIGGTFPNTDGGLSVLQRFNAADGSNVGGALNDNGTMRQFGRAPNESSFAVNLNIDTGANYRLKIFSSDFSETTEVSVPTSITGLAYSPDSTRIAVSSGSTGRIFTLASPPTSAPPTLTSSIGGGMLAASRSLAMSPDGMWLVTGRTTGNQFQIWNAATGQNTFVGDLGTVGAPWVRSAAFSPDSSEFALGVWTANGEIRRFNPATGDEIGFPIIWTGAGSVGNIGYINNTRIMIANDSSRVVRVYDNDGTLWSESASLGASGTLLRARVSPNGDRIAVSTSTPQIHVLNVAPSTLVDVTNSPVVPPANGNGLGWNPNGNQIATNHVGGTVNVWNPADLTAGPTFVGSHTGNGLDLTYTANGSMIISGGADGIRIFDTASLTEADFFNGVGQVANVATTASDRFAFTDNGTRLAMASLAGGGGGTIFWEGPDSGPLPRLMVGWRTSGGNVVLPTVVIDIAPATWQVRTVGPVFNGPVDDLVWQNIDPAFSIPGLIAYWTLDQDGTPSPGGIGGAPPTFDWQVSALRDLNGDGNGDILWVNADNGAVAIWYRDGSGNVVGTASVGVVPAGWSLITAGTDNRVFFQNDTTTQVAYWTLDNMGGITGTTSVGVPGADWQLSGFGQFNTGPALLFLNSNTNLLAYWEIDDNGLVTGTGTLGEAPPGWSILAVGRL